METAGEPLVIVGASARAAAFSALRAGLRPWCADLFRDTDLAARCPGVAVPPEAYPDALARLVAEAPPGPWLYTGALENRPALVEEIGRRRPLWGNGAAALAVVRNPVRVHTILTAARVPCPAVRLEAPEPGGRWLVKPLHGAGGARVRFWTGRPLKDGRRSYFQEYVEGRPCAAIYVGAGGRAELLGVTRQLVGETWLHAAPFHYCGSVGPLLPEERQREAFQRLGDALAAGGRLRGLFGVDCVLCDGIPWPVEVNPRYTASVEVLELTRGIAALAAHRRVFDPDAPEAPPASRPAGAVVGKAVLFAEAPLSFPADGPWSPALASRFSPWAVPAFADVPPAGQRVEAGRPVLTLFAAGASEAACLDELRRRAGDLDRRLRGR